jgi:hypothetical protein
MEIKHGDAKEIIPFEFKMGFSLGRNIFKGTQCLLHSSPKEYRTKS